ncbi:uncharacterized protein A1O9_12463 [Exophiala aquamarina CBS 119918]|uniref:Transcription factor domain-containing protein n=1 Tax=Exophiala aquamarina CBS 119918 TaxID=1182545 RepID=A0A072NV86_9EURO|nr:uncharacterized protein A1O9_12463 [Exophiala aquamarina CBS 119918]KEF51546.1 hypothetical protein A1O9_12463 [Exophiala aquamarina CBS 119918]
MINTPNHNALDAHHHVPSTAAKAFAVLELHPGFFGRLAEINFPDSGGINDRSPDDLSPTPLEDYSQHPEARESPGYEDYGSILTTGTLSHKLNLNSNISRSLERRDNDSLIAFYTHTWAKHCLPALHTTFQYLEPAFGPSPVVTDIMISLSACCLSRRLPQRKVSSSPHNPVTRFRPNNGHESLSYEHYGTVMRRVAGWDHQAFDTNPVLGLFLLVLFCYLEASMGNFRNFRIHSNAIKILTEKYSDIVTLYGADLLAAWVDVEAQNWWRRAYFSTPDFHRDQLNSSSQLLSSSLGLVLQATKNPRASVLLILCESHRLNSAAIVSNWSSIQGDQTVIQSDDPSSPKSVGLGSTPSTSNIRQHIMHLQVQSQMLDKWHMSQPASNLPLSEPERDSHTIDRLSINIIHPLRFASHDAAMNFAYYVTARVMQCTGPLEQLEQRLPVEASTAYEAERWISILIGIATGLDWKECVRLNVYRVGLANLLLAGAMHCHSLEIGLWFQSWLERQVEDNDLEEGNFPLSQILDTLYLVNMERSNGWDVIALFQTEDDGGGSGKFGSYHSQDLRSLTVYGRSRATGELCVYTRMI